MGCRSKWTGSALIHWLQHKCKHQCDDLSIVLVALNYKGGALQCARKEVQSIGLGHTGPITTCMVTLLLLCSKFEADLSQACAARKNSGQSCIAGNMWQHQKISTPKSEFQNFSCKVGWSHRKGLLPVVGGVGVPVVSDGGDDVVPLLGDGGGEAPP